MKIIISAIAFDKGRSGISNYIENTIKSLSEYVDVDVLINASDRELFIGYKDNVNFIEINKIVNSPIFSVFWHLFVLPIKLINNKEYDFIFLPSGNRRLMSFYPIKTIVTMHDLSQFRVTDKYDKKRMFYIKKVIPFFLSGSSEIISVSQSTKNDLIKYYNISENKVHVNFNGVDLDKFKKEKKDNKINNGKKFFLYVSRLENPGKNHINLISAYNNLPKEIQDEYDLIFIGAEWEGSEVITDYAKTLESSDNIKFKGFVSNEDLPIYFATTSLFIFPSLFEGFGIPLLQAMASSVPVISSNTSSMPEVCGDAAEYFNPLKINEIKDKIIKVISDDSISKDLISKGLNQVTNFSWDLHAKKILEINKGVLR